MEYYIKEKETIMMKMENIKTALSLSQYKSSKFGNEGSRSSVIRNQIEKDVMLSAILNIIDEKAVDMDCKVNFDIISNPTNYMGLTTLVSAKRIDIEVKEKIDHCYLRAVFAHEMGEANYLLNRFPIICTENLHDNELIRITEVFSHLHIRQLLMEENLYFLHEILDEMDAEKWLCQRNYTAKEKWKNVLMLCWGAVTYPTVYKRRQEILLYKEIKSEVDPIIGRILLINTLRKVSSQDIESEMHNLVELLIKYGLPIEKVPQIVIPFRNKSINDIRGSITT